MVPRMKPKFLCSSAFFNKQVTKTAINTKQMFIISRFKKKFYYSLTPNAAWEIFTIFSWIFVINIKVSQSFRGKSASMWQNKYSLDMFSGLWRTLFYFGDIFQYILKVFLDFEILYVKVCIACKTIGDNFFHRFYSK